MLPCEAAGWSRVTRGERVKPHRNTPCEASRNSFVSNKKRPASRHRRSLGQLEMTKTTVSVSGKHRAAAALAGLWRLSWFHRRRATI